VRVCVERERESQTDKETEIQRQSLRQTETETEYVRAHVTVCVCDSVCFLWNTIRTLSPSSHVRDSLFVDPLNVCQHMQESVCIFGLIRPLNVLVIALPL